MLSQTPEWIIEIPIFRGKEIIGRIYRSTITKHIYTDRCGKSVWSKRD